MPTAQQRYALTLEYDGSGYAGFQTQRDLPTIQEETERALSTILRSSIIIAAAGRTDAGVHSLGQIVSFESEPIQDAKLFLYSVNAILPKDIVVRKLCSVPANFHARFSCIAREYEYRIWNEPDPTPFMKKRILWVRRPLQIDVLNAIAAEIPGERDFASLTRTEYRNGLTYRYVDKASWKERECDSPSGKMLVFLIRGNAFLHNMIRILIGTTLDIATGKLKRSMGDIIRSCDRLQAGYTAPSIGLYFHRAYYPPSMNDSCLPTLYDYPVFGSKAKPQ